MLNTYVEVIPATKEMYAPKMGRKKLNVAAYCRVSTAEEEQQDSFENQVEHYKSMIEANDEWDLVEIFGDDGITGTSATKRPGFRRMIKMCEQGKIDLIITKSISRFSRNTPVTLEYVRKLKLMGIGIIFEKENLNTLEVQSEFLLSMYSTFAQQESESQSMNVKMGKRFRYSQGQACFNFNRVYGYGQDDKKNIYIVPEQAKAVKLIFTGFQKGLSMREIADSLEKENIPSPSGKPVWKTEAVKRILVNEKYAGDVMTQKTYIVDPISKKTKKNTGRFPKYLIRNHHVAIIDREIFDAVQIELSRRNCIKRNENINDYGKYSGKYPFNNMIVCGECGAKYRRTMWVTRDKQKEYVWRCISRLEHGKKKCKHSPSIKEEFLISAVTEAANSMITDVVYAKELLKGAVAEVMGDNMQSKLNENSARMNELNEKLSQALTKNLNGEISLEEMDKIFSEIRNDQLKLRHENDAYEKRRQIESADREKLKTIFKTIDEMPEEIDRLEDDSIRMLFDRIEVISKNELRICSADYAYTVNM
ncbi:MAG: recombinase family protein [Ruminococcaceae bacterium]|nr:recombinase family protein [Oscillospiraceae bacterium]